MDNERTTSARSAPSGLMITTTDVSALFDESSETSALVRFGDKELASAEEEDDPDGLTYH